MRASIELYLLKHWYGTHQPPWFLRILEPVYKAAFRRSQAKQKARSGDDQSGVSVVVVGNITAGGSGKTPLVIALSELAKNMQIKTGIASTGYGRQSRDTIVVQADSDTRLCGDEPVLLAKRCGVPVVVAASRIEAVQKLRDMGVDLVISDDGLQQADLKRDLEICVIDGSRGLGNGHQLPAGPLRESLARLSLVDQLISNGSWVEKPEKLDISVMNLTASVVRSLDDMTQLPLAEFQQKYSAAPVQAVAAIGNPARFFALLTQYGIDHTEHVFADHHRFEKRDFASMTTATAIVMTEKDAVKCLDLGLDNAWYIPVDAELPEEFQNWFRSKLLDMTGDAP